MSRTAMGRFPRGFRRRLALTFVLVAGVASGVLAVGATLIVTSYRHHTFRDRARVEAARVIERLPPAGDVDLETTQAGGPDVLVVQGDSSRTSASELTIADVPDELRRRVDGAPGTLVQGTTSIDGRSFLVVGTSSPETGRTAYVFFSREELLRGLIDLRVTLLLGWVAVVAAAAVVGTVVARRTLRPVREAADAARSVAEGLLHVRLDEGGTDEFARWAASFNEMVSALEEKIAALAEAGERERRFNADIAHELRTPLGSLVTAATLLEQQGDDLPGHLRRPAEIVVAGARRMHRLVDELLELHRLEAGHEAVDAERVDVEELLRTAITANGWDDRVRLRLEARPVLSSDPRRIDRIVVNLVGNALAHGGGAAEVVVDERPGTVTVAVVDHGPGIDDAELTRLFDRYYKVSRARTGPAAGSVSGGSGLGLSIALEQAKLLGGHLSVDSAVGRGTTFTVHLPVGAHGADPDAA